MRQQFAGVLVFRVLRDYFLYYFLQPGVLHYRAPAAFVGGALYSPPACLEATTPVLKSAGFRGGRDGGLPWLAEARSSGLLRAA